MSELVQVICWIYKQVNEMWKRESLVLFAARVVLSAAVHVSSPLMDFQPELQFLMEGGRMERR